jgi:hypothetical protein
MAHFAELDINNKVLRVLVACNIDVNNNGGDKSEQAAKYFETKIPFSENGVKWVQCSYNKNFRKDFPGINGSYDPIRDEFVRVQPFPSWSLNNTNDWVAPIPCPEPENEYIWEESLLNWVKSSS